MIVNIVFKYNLIVIEDVIYSLFNEIYLNLVVFYLFN